MSLLAALGWATVAGVCGYVVGAVAGAYTVSVLSTNRHDRSQEAGMTGAFVIGPLAGILTFLGTLVALWW